jgi:molybdate transport repressor ModE-like protein
MISIDIRPVWRFRSDGSEREFDFQLVTLLGELDAAGKLTQAAEKAGISYRHAWNLIAEWEAFFGAPLVVKERGRGSTLSALGERLLWAGRRAHARLAPELDNLAAEFARSVNESLHDRAAALVMQASHDFAVGALRDLAAAEGLDIELQYRGSFDALGALRRGECDVAGFHVADGPLAPLMTHRYAECLPLGDFRLIPLVERKQGFIVLPGNPKRIDSVGDLCRRGRAHGEPPSAAPGTRALARASRFLGRPRPRAHAGLRRRGGDARRGRGDDRRPPGRRRHRRAGRRGAISPRLRPDRDGALLSCLPPGPPRGPGASQAPRSAAKPAVRRGRKGAARLHDRPLGEDLPAFDVLPSDHLPTELP